LRQEEFVSQDRPAELYGLIVPLEQDRLLVPRGCVAEVVGYQTPQEMTGAPPWHLGIIKWNGRDVPLVSFEGCAGGDVAPPTQRSRVVVLNAVSEQVEAGYIAILSQGFPQLVRISPEFVKPDGRRTFPDDSPIACQIQLLDETPVVPNLDRLEEMVAQETEQLPGDSDAV
jgi:chemosensory pili system protein ChpC